MPVYGATYGGLTWNSFINANNFSTGCQLEGLAKPCSQVIFGAMNGFYEPKSGSLLPFGAVIEDWKPVAPGHQPPPGSRIVGEFAFEPEYGFSGNLFREPNPQKTGDELQHARGPCPPTQDVIFQSSALKQRIEKAQENAAKLAETGIGFIEHGGWILWKQGTRNKFTYLVKDPQTRFNTPPGFKYTDTATRVWLHDPPSPPKGWEIVAIFHIHPDNAGDHGGDDAASDQSKVPGFVGQPDGKIHKVGNYKRGFLIVTYLRTAAKSLQELTAKSIMGRVSLRLVVALLTFTVGLTVAAIWMTRKAPKLEEPVVTKKKCFPGLGQKIKTLKAGEDGYFPEKAFYRDEERNRLISNFYTRYLKQMNDPSLVESYQGYATYRFLWLRSFHSTVVVRLWSESERQMLSVKELSRKTETQSSQLIVDQTRSLKMEEWDGFMNLIDESCFWEVPVTSAGPIAMDGAWWVLEGADSGYYHVRLDSLQTAARIANSAFMC